jgi:hypothetical protein
VRRALVIAIAVVVGSILSPIVRATQLWAGVARADITNTQAGPVNDRLYVKTLVLRQDATTAAIITLDAVAIGQSCRPHRRLPSRLCGLFYGLFAWSEPGLVHNVGREARDRGVEGAAGESFSRTIA